jgi:predicted GTPase
VTTKARKHDLRTRVARPTYDQVCRFAVAQNLTPYAATERLVLLGLDTLGNTTTTDAETRQALDHLAAKMDLLAGMTDRALFGAMVSYAYARHVATDALDAAQRQTLDQAITQSAEGAYRRQRAKVLGGEP